MVQNPSAPSTVGSSTFIPDRFLEKWAIGEFSAPQGNDLESAIKKVFGLNDDDQYVYHAIATVTLRQVQSAINQRDKHGLHAWYRDDAGQQILPPPIVDIDAYTAIFASTTSTTKALIAFEKNAKKGSLRAAVANNIISSRIFPPNVTVPKLKSPHVNPYLDFWSWSCRTLEWVGPDFTTVNVKQSHHILPVFYHHFGCVCPTYESLEAIRQVAQGRPVVEVGSGNGYWTYMLRRMGMTVLAVDNGDSIWRTMWIGDTVKIDGARYLSKEKGAKDTILLLVYPQVSTDFTTSVLKAYAGTTICVAGTQNANGYTAFKDFTIDKHMDVKKPDYKKIMQIALPSFAAKDEALFIFEHRL